MEPDKADVAFALQENTRSDPPGTWLRRYEPGVPSRVPEADAPFDAILRAVAASAPTFPGVTYLRRTLRYADLDLRVERVARAIAGSPGGKPPRVVLALPNCPEFVAIALGALRAGAVVRVVDDPSPRGALGVDSLREEVRRTAPGHVFATVSTARALAGDRPAGAAIIGVDPAQGLPLQIRLLVAAARGLRGSDSGRLRSDTGWSELGAWLAASAPGTAPVDIAPDSPALELGSHTFAHRHLVSGAAQLRSWLTDAIPGDETWLLLSPLSEPLAFTAGLGAAVALRARLALLPEWQVEDVVDAIRFLRPTWVASDGRSIERLADHPAVARADVRSVRAWITADPASERAERRFANATGIGVCRGLTLPGAAGLVACNPVNGTRAAGSVGLPMPGVRVQAGADGRLSVSGPNIAGDPNTGGWLPLPQGFSLGDEGFLYPPSESAR